MTTSKRISVVSWLDWKNNRPEIVALMPKIEITAEQQGLYRNITIMQAKRAGVSKHNCSFGNYLGAIFDWLDDNCVSPYYVEFKSNEISSRYHKYTEFNFYFTDNIDAISFKLMFLNDNNI